MAFVNGYNLLSGKKSIDKLEETCIQELRQKAFMLEGNAILGLTKNVNFIKHSDKITVSMSLSGTVVMCKSLDKMPRSFQIAQEAFESHASVRELLRKYV